MSDRSTKRESGFSLLEMMIAMAVGMIVLGAATQLYIQGVNATWTISQRAELQQDFRAASNILTRDLSLAGAGLQPPGVAIALPTALPPRYGCDQTGACYLGLLNNAGVSYPLNPLVGGVPTLYGLIPGYKKGPTLPSNPEATDVVTVVYTDTSLYLNCYTASVTAAGKVTFGPSTTLVGGVLPAFPPAGCLPTGVAAPQTVNDTVVGLTPGDLVYFPTLGVVAEVTAGGITTGNNAVGPTYTVPFANGDALNMNQTTAPKGLNSLLVGAQDTSPYRLLVITYYIDNIASPSRLMRQVSGHTPMPVADGLEYMKFSYDLYDTLHQKTQVRQNDGGAALLLLPNQITKINIEHMAMESTLKGVKGYQGLDLETSVSARNLTYVNKYPFN
jgi:prepilin-type N-terminal cleavage/methylation domain-containing protein